MQIKSQKLDYPVCDLEWKNFKCVSSGYYSQSCSKRVYRQDHTYFEGVWTTKIYDFLTMILASSMNKLLNRHKRQVNKSLFVK